jgi:hypothetical protein
MPTAGSSKNSFSPRKWSPRKSPVAGEHDQRVIPAVVALQKIEQPPELIIDLFDQAHVGRNHRQPYFVTGEVEALLMLAKRLVNRVIAGLPANRWICSTPYNAWYGAGAI